MILLSMLRPPPTVPLSTNGRMVISADGVQVPIEEPFRGVAFTWGAWGVSGYLENTREPDTVLVAGGHRQRENFGRYGLMHKVYPQIFRENHFWDLKYGELSLMAKTGIEPLLAYNAGVYLANGGNYGMGPTLRQAGLPAIYLSWRSKNWDEVGYQAARVENALIGHPELGEALIKRFQEANKELAQELHPEALLHRPLMLMMGCSAKNWSYFYVKSYRNDYRIYYPLAGVENASSPEYTGESPDAERILEMDPDIIFLTGSRDFPNTGESPQEFMHDPRWRDLKAVKERRVYRMFGGGGLGGLIFQPLYNRFMAEIAHPDILQPKLRQLLRDRILTEFNYRLSDDEIDEMLNVDENAGSAGAERFTRSYIAQKIQELKQ